MFNLLAPNGLRIVGTYDLIPGIAWARRFSRNDDGTYEAEYAGETEVLWDGQRPMTQDGQKVYVDVLGTMWREKDLTAVPATDDDE